MFRKVIESLSRSFSSSKQPVAKRRQAADGSILEKMVKPPGKAADQQTGVASASAEQLCGITRGMGKAAISERLKRLYRRHNRAASSLDATLRAESERMLDAIVEVREKHFGKI